jgi:diadenylate cyclase
VEEQRRDKELIQSLRLVAPGTELREGISRILSAHNGALIVIGDSEDVLAIINGGFRIDCDFSAPRLYQLCKMDGAVILSEDLSTIRYANVHLVPDPSIPSKEGGTRHRTAERVAKQTNKLVIAISERLERVTLYRRDWKHVLEDPRVVISKSTQALQALEKYKMRLDQVSQSLSALEVDNLVTLQDVAKVLQRSEMMSRIATEIELYLSELGVEGRLIALQLEELMAGVEKEKENVIRDYRVEEHGRSVEAVQRSLSRLSSEELLQLTNIAQTLGYSGAQDELDRPLIPRGYRVLNRIPRLPSSVVDKLVKHFKNLQSVMNASLESLDEVDGVGKARAVAIQDGLRRIADSSIIDHYL